MTGGSKKKKNCGTRVGASNGEQLPGGLDLGHLMDYPHSSQNLLESNKHRLKKPVVLIGLLVLQYVLIYTRKKNC